MRALDDVVRDGKVLYVGVWDTPAWVVAQANTVAAQHDWTPFSALQAPYSLLQRDIERELLPMAHAFGMSVSAWSPLAGGILSGKFTRQGGPGPGTRVSPGTLTERDLAVARSVDEIATEVGASASQVAIAWTRARTDAVHPIIGTRRLDQLLDNLAAVDCTLPAEALRRLDDASDFVAGFPTDFINETSP